MTEYIPYVTSGGLLIVCLALVRMMNGKLHNKISRSECHAAQESVQKRIDDFQKHMDERFEDMKDFIKNGK